MILTERKFSPATLSAVEADGTFTGYASLFGRPDLGRDMVMPGAFRASLARRGAGGVKMLFQHDPNTPIGVWLEIREDGEGLFVKGRLTTQGGEGARGAVADARRRPRRALDRLSHRARAHRRQDRRARALRGRPVGDLGGHLSHAARGARRERQGRASASGAHHPQGDGAVAARG